MSLLDTFFTERAGVNAVAAAVNGMRCIWRETPLADIGIDGQIEYLTSDGVPTAQIVGVQVKSGASYFRRISGDAVVYVPSDTHRAYWARFPVPVILVLHDPRDGRLLWSDVRRQLSGGLQAVDSIRVPFNATFPPPDRDAVFATCGPQSRELLAPPELLDFMLAATTRSTAFDISFFDLFVHGMTSIMRKLYFGMDLCMSIAEFKLDYAGSDLGIGIGHGEYEFLHRYVTFLVEQRLITLSWPDYVVEIEDLGLQDTWVSALTERGRALVSYISASAPGLMEERPVVIQERPRDAFRMQLGEAFKHMRKPGADASDEGVAKPEGVPVHIMGRDSDER